MEIDTGDILDIGLTENDAIDDIDMLDQEMEDKLLNDNEEKTVQVIKKETVSPDEHKIRKVNTDQCEDKNKTESHKKQDSCKSQKSKSSSSKKPEIYDLPVDESYKSKYNHRQAVENVKCKDMFKHALIDFKRLNKHLSLKKDTDPSIAGREMTFRLQEPKMCLITQIVRVLGVELSVEIFEETKKIVNEGGLKTDSGDRKRSPGGTFIYIMKNRGYATNRQMKEIFKFENEKKKKLRKREAAQKRVESKHVQKREV